MLPVIFAALLPAAQAAVPAPAVDTLARSGAWHGEKVFEGGEYTETRAAWDQLSAQATDAELRGLLGHAAAGVRFGALIALAQRGQADALPAAFADDTDTVTVCPGGCRCAVVTIAGGYDILKQDAGWP